MTSTARTRWNTEKYQEAINNKFKTIKCEEVYVGGRTPTKHVCNIHGTFYAKPESILSKRTIYGCIDCANKGQGNSKRQSEEIINKLIYERHKGTIKFNKPYKGNTKTINEFICKEKHVWRASTGNVISQTGCPVCSRKLGNTKRAHPEDYIIKEIFRIHGRKISLNELYKFNIHKNHSFKCNKNHSWTTSVANVILGSKTGCPQCCRSPSFSKAEKQWIDLMRRKVNSNILTMHDEPINIYLPGYKKSIRPDGYDPNTKTVYEFHGDYWHGNLMKYKRSSYKIGRYTTDELNRKTRKREKALLKAGYKVVYCWESNFKKYLKGKFWFRKLPYTEAIMSKSPYCR